MICSVVPMTATEQGATPRPITPEDLYRFTYVGDPQLSPDGRTVAFIRTTIDKEADAYRTQIWLVTHSERLAAALAKHGGIQPRTVIKREGQTWIEGLRQIGRFDDEE